MNAVLYARVSTEKQAEKELSIPAQLTAMREYARKNGWTISEEFLEPGASARTTERPMLKRMLARCKEAPKVDVVVVHKVDRLARDLYGHATIKTMLKQRGIRLASVVENVDDSITGQLVENIMASLAEFYSANLGEEVKKGMRVMVQRGEWPHQPPRGYRIIRTVQNRPLAVPFETESVPIAEAFRLVRDRTLLIEGHRRRTFAPWHFYRKGPAPVLEQCPEHAGKPVLLRANAMERSLLSGPARADRAGAALLAGAERLAPPLQNAR